MLFRSILMLSRFNAVLAIYFYPYVSKGGIASLAKEELKISQVLIASLYVATLTLLASKLSLIFFSLAILYFIGIFFVKRYGGFTGDIYGFSIEVSELVLINYLIILL